MSTFDKHTVKLLAISILIPLYTSPTENIENKKVPSETCSWWRRGTKKDFLTLVALKGAGLFFSIVCLMSSLVSSDSTRNSGILFSVMAIGTSIIGIRGGMSGLQQIKTNEELKKKLQDLKEKSNTEGIVL